MPGLTVVGACELGQDAERAGLGGTGAWLPVLSVLDQPFLAMVIGDEARKVLHPKAVSAHTPKSSIRQVWVSTTPRQSLWCKLQPIQRPWNRGHAEQNMRRLMPSLTELMDSHYEDFSWVLYRLINGHYLIRDHIHHRPYRNWQQFTAYWSF